MFERDIMTRHILRASFTILRHMPVMPNSIGLRGRWFGLEGGLNGLQVRLVASKVGPRGQNDLLRWLLRGTNWRFPPAHVAGGAVLLLRFWGGFRRTQNIWAPWEELGD